MAPKKEKAPPPSSKPAKSGGGGKQKTKKWSKGKQKEKVNNAVLFDQASYDNMPSEVPKYKPITPSVLSERSTMAGVKRDRQVSSNSRRQRSAAASQPSVMSSSASPALVSQPAPVQPSTTCRASGSHSSIPPPSISMIGASQAFALQHLHSSSPVAAPCSPSASQAVPSAPQTPRTASSSSSTAIGTNRKRGRGPALGIRVRQLRGLHRLPVELQRGNAVGNNGHSFTTFCGILARMHCRLWQQEFRKLPTETKEAIFQDLTQHFIFPRSPANDDAILRHMGALLRNKRCHLKKKHFTGKSFVEAVADVPKMIDPDQWQRMCEIWREESSKKIAERNVTNRAHYKMTYIKGRTSHRQLNYDFNKAHGRDATRPEIFHMSYSKAQPDGTVVWTSEQSQRMMEQMTQLMHPPESSRSEPPPTALTSEDAFIQIMGRDKPGRIRCGGRGETRRTWYPSQDINDSSYRSFMEQQSRQQSELESLRAEIEGYKQQVEQSREEIRAEMQSELHVEIQRQMAQIFAQQKLQQLHQQSDDPEGQREAEEDEHD